MLAVHPELEKYVSAELKDEFKGAEARRKCHEESLLAKGVGRGKQKKDE